MHISPMRNGNNETTGNGHEEWRALALNLAEHQCHFADAPDGAARLRLRDAMELWETGEDVWCQPGPRIAIAVGTSRGAKKKLNRRLLSVGRDCPGAGKPAVDDGATKLFIFICPESENFAGHYVISEEIEDGLSVHTWPDGMVRIPGSARITPNLRHVNEFQIERLGKAFRVEKRVGS